MIERSSFARRLVSILMVRLLNTQLLIGVFLLCVLAWDLSVVRLFASWHAGWQMGDWLINYSGGFVRRGLSGELLLMFSAVSGLSIVRTYAVTVGLLYVIFFATLFLLIYRKKTPFWFLLMLFSPVTLLFSVNDYAAVARKEIIYFTMLALYVLRLGGSTVVTRGMLIAAAATAGAIATLMHELFIFYTPYFFAASWMASGYRSGRMMSIATAVAAGSGLATIAVFAGSTMNTEVICARLLAAGLGDSICGGILAWPVRSFDDALRYTFEIVLSENYSSVYGVSFLLGMLPLVMLFLQEGYKSPRFVNSSALIVVVALAFSSPLFGIATDWGRFLNIHFMSLMILSTLLLQRAEPQPSVPNAPAIAVRAKGFRSVPVALALSILTFVYVFTWGMPHASRPLNDGLVRALQGGIPPVTNAQTPAPPTKGGSVSFPVK